MSYLVFPNTVNIRNRGNHRIKPPTRSGANLYQTWSKSGFAQFVRCHFPQSADLHLAALTAIPATTIRKHIYGETKPSADHVMQYLGLFGPALLVAVMGGATPSWIHYCAQQQARQDLENQVEDLKQTIAQL